MMERLKPDVYHCVTYACPLLVPCPTVFTVHDLLPLERPEAFPLKVSIYFRTMVRLAAIKARRIVTVSSYTFSSLCRRLSVPPGKMRVIFNGGDHMTRSRITPQDEDDFHRINPDNTPFFLSVANRRTHKNISFSVSCFLESRELQKRGIVYFLVGRQHQDVYACLRRQGPETRIRVLEYISDGLLSLLYQRAIALLCPSFGEGFFLPAVEAMQFGVPVLAARDGALPEVIGPAGVMLPPQGVAAWQNAMVRVLQERLGGQYDSSRVKDHARNFSWERTAKQTLDLYEEIKDRC